ncbi:hypothetical protein C0993_010403, partial [Termitomyces sp. T159_Od127]
TGNMAQELDEQLSKLWKNDWVDLRGLVTCATLHLFTSESPSIDCVSISLLGQGSYNTVYRLAFSDDTEVAASVCQYDESKFNPEAKRSEIATMKFVRESGLYPDVPVPKVLAWDFTFTNAARAPYVLMEVVPGVTTKLTKGISGDLDTDSLARDFALIKSLAKLQASLSKPVPFNQIGSLVTDVDGKFVLGPLMTMSQGTLGGPFKSIHDLWRLQLEGELMQALTEWGNLETDNSALTWFGVVCTPHMYAELFQFLSALIPHFEPPKSCRSLVLYHPDIALRNVLFDESSLSSSDSPRVTGVLDWAGAQILPAMFTAHYPLDLITDRDSPFTHPNRPREDWMTVPCDWTSTGDISDWPQTFCAVNVPYDNTPGVHRNIRQFYLRTHFSACYAEQLYAQRGIADLACATMFKDAPYYLKFDEVIGGGWQHWVKHRTWIRETYWRLRMAGHGSKGSEELVVGPNVYLEPAEAPVCDLGIFAEYPRPEENPTRKGETL